MGLVYLLGKKKQKREYVDPEDGKIYGVSINLSERNPDLGVTYIEDSVGFTPARGNDGNFIFGSWQNKFPFDRIKPCLFKDGAVVTYLNPNNYRQDVNGNYVDVTTGISGDVMIEFPTVYWKIQKVGNTLEVRYSKDKIDDSYKALAHMRNTVLKDKLYIGAYMASVPGNQMYSRSGQTVTNNININTYRSYAKAKGSSYDILAFYQLTLLQVLFVVMFQSRNSKSAFGSGIFTTGGNRNTGVNDTSGMYYAVKDNITQNKLFGIESIYGNYSQLIDGIKVESGYVVKAGTYLFAEEPFTYDTIGTVSSLSGVLTNVIGTTEGGFFPSATGSSADDGNYFASEGNVTANRFVYFGGHSGKAIAEAGMFNIEANVTATGQISARSTRLMYL